MKPWNCKNAIKINIIGEILVKMDVMTREQLITYVCEYDMRVVKETYE